MISGTHQTQWNGHDTGDTSSPVIAQTTTPVSSSPRRAARIASASPTTPVTTASTGP